LQSLISVVIAQSRLLISGTDIENPDFLAGIEYAEKFALHTSYLFTRRRFPTLDLEELDSFLQSIDEKKRNIVDTIYGHLKQPFGLLHQCLMWYWLDSLILEMNQATKIF
jgi:hypothetical protein